VDEGLLETLRAKGDYEGVRELQERAIDVLKRVSGEEHPDTVVAMNNLAITLGLLGDYDATCEVIERVLEINEQVHGEQHPATLRAIADLAGARCSQGDYEGAHELALTLLELDDCKGAHDLLERILEARRTILGDEHPRTLETMSDLGITLLYLGEYEDSRMLRDRVLEASRTSKVTKVNWCLAQRVANRITDRRASKDTTTWPVTLSVVEVAHRIAAYTGIECPSELPRVEIVDYGEWSADRHKHELLGSISRNQAFYSPARRGAGGWIAARLQSTARDLRGVAEGIRTGSLAGETAAHYQFFQEDPSAARLVLVSPNIAAWAKSHKEWDDAVLWIVIHELTHVFQYIGVAWTPDYEQELREGMRGQVLQTQPGDKRDYIAAFKQLRKELASAIVGRATVAPTMQFDLFHTVLEGHAEHVADVLAMEMLSRMPAARARQLKKREDPPKRRFGAGVRERFEAWRGPVRDEWYGAGLRFCDSVAQRAGPEVLSNLWREPAALPNEGEITDPGLWLARFSG
jgi:uncharacterized protein (DUF2342 family)